MQYPRGLRDRMLGYSYNMPCVVYRGYYCTRSRRENNVFFFFLVSINKAAATRDILDRVYRRSTLYVLLLLTAL